MCGEVAADHISEDVFNFTGRGIYDIDTIGGYVGIRMGYDLVAPNLAAIIRRFLAEGEYSANAECDSDENMCFLGVHDWGLTYGNELEELPDFLSQVAVSTVLMIFDATLSSHVETGLLLRQGFCCFVMDKASLS